MELLFAALNLAQFLPLAIFGFIAVVAWTILERLSAEKPRAEQRLDEFRDPAGRRKKAEERGSVKTADAMTKMLEKASPKLAKSITPTDANKAGQLKARLAHAGFRGEATTSIFLGLKIIALVAGFFIGGGSMLLVKGATQDAIMWTIGIAGCMFYLPDVIVWLMARSRKEAIFLGLPDALDLMVVCVEAGLGLDQAMRKVADEMKSTYRVISEEFALCNFQLQMGRERSEVLHELGYRTGVDDVRALAAIIIQADKFGSSIAQALRVQSDSMRTRRRQLAEERAAKTAVKLIFPLVLFIFPAIFVVLVGPAAITMINEMFPAMNGGR
jgi:tight adherence protein C